MPQTASRQFRFKEIKNIECDGTQLIINHEHRIDFYSSSVCEVEFVDGFNQCPDCNMNLTRFADDSSEKTSE